MKNTKIILLISSPRSGTNYLCSLLNNIKHIDVNHEIFHSDYSYLNNETLIYVNNNLIRKNNDLWDIRKNITNYLKTNSKKDFLFFLRNNSNKDYLFLKVFPNHLTQNCLKEIVDISEFKIVMQRNFIDSYISQKKAKISNAFQNKNTSHIMINFSISEYNKYKNNISSFFNNFKHLPTINYEYFFSLGKKEQIKLFFKSINQNINIDNITINNTLKKQDLQTDYSKKIENYNKDIEYLIHSEINAYTHLINNNDFKYHS